MNNTLKIICHTDIQLNGIRNCINIIKGTEDAPMPKRFDINDNEIEMLKIQ